MEQDDKKRREEREPSHIVETRAHNINSIKFACLTECGAFFIV